jgi:hypothetical protein
MSLVGKNFQVSAVDAISEMGDNMKINILKKLKQQKSDFVLVPKGFYFRLSN